MRWDLLTVLSSIWIAVSAAPLSLLTASNITKPSEDPFYQPGLGYESMKLGEVINYRKVLHPYGLLTLDEKIAAAYQFLVRSEDSLGNATAIVTTLLIPHNADPTKLLSYQVAIDSPNPNCSPSYAMQYGSDPSTWITAQIEVALLHSGLYEGWYVVVPDFLGPKGSFAAGIQAGHATLDSLIAVLNSGQVTGIDPNAAIVLWGYSGGSQPSVWGPSLAPDYAPNLNIIGAAAGGVLVDPLHIANVSINKPWAGLIVEAVLGLANEYPEVEEYIEEKIYPDARAGSYAAKDRCLLGNLAAYVDVNWADATPEGNAVLDNPLVTRIASENNLLDLEAKPKVPLFFYNSINDEIIPASDTDKLYDKWCDEGVSIEYRQDIVSEHVTQAVIGAGDAFEWIKARFAGEPQSGCKKINSVSNLFNIDSITGLSTLVADIVNSYKGEEIGPSRAFKNSSLIGNSTSSSNHSTSSPSLTNLSLLGPIFRLLS